MYIPNPYRIPDTRYKKKEKEKRKKKREKRKEKREKRERTCAQSINGQLISGTYKIKHRTPDTRPTIINPQSEIINQASDIRHPTSNIIPNP